MKICIDAGHNFSGADTGATGIGGLREQDITFSIANILREKLISKGHDIIMTRNNLTDNLGTTVSESLSKRVEISNSNNCDFFISIHCNSGVASASGTETLIAGIGGMAEEYAKNIQSSITTATGTLNRGVRVDTEYLKTRLYVLHNTICPAVLIETGFITNEEDAKKLRDNAEGFATAIASAFSDEISASPFTDIQNHWARIHIEKLYAYGIVNGYSDGTFLPDKPITRAEAAAIVSNALSVLGK